MRIKKPSISCLECPNTNCLIKKNCTDEELKEISLHKKMNKIVKGQPIFFENNPARGIYFIQEGKVKIFKNRIFEKQQVVRLATSGKILGHRGLSNDFVYPVSAAALEDSLICYFDKDFFFLQFEKSPKLAIELMLFFANELTTEENKLRDMVNFNVKEKVMKALLIIVEAFGLEETGIISGINLLSRQEIGEIVGLTANQVSKSLSELKEENLIQLIGKKIKVVSVEKLEEGIPKSTQW